MSMSLLAAVVTPALLYAGFASASVPILIHLLSRRRFRRTRWAAMDFLLEADRQNRRRMRIEQLVLLALRCLAMFLIGLLIARWYVQPQALASVLGGTKQTERFVVLDDSFSMGYQIDNRTRFDDAKAAAVRLARWVQQESPQDTLTILAASRSEQPIAAGLQARETSPDGLRALLEETTCSQRGACVREAVQSVRKLLDARPGTVNATVYVISDFQASEWLASETTPGAGSPLAALRGWGEPGRSLRVVLIDVGEDDAENTSVISLRSDQRQVVAGVPARFIAEVTHYGRRSAEPEELRVYVGEAMQPPVPVPAIAPGQVLQIPIELVFPAPGGESISVELPDDRLPVDNRRTASVDVQRAVRVLIVNGEPEPDTFTDEVALLSPAIRSEGPVYSGNDVEIVDEAALGETNLAGYHVVILANVYRVSEAVAASLEQFAAAGGGVVFFGGDQIDPELYNRVLYRDGQGLLPARLGERVEAPPHQAGFAFIDPDATHPMLRPLTSADVPFFSGIATQAFLAATVAPTATQPATQPTTTAPTNRPAARVLLSYDNADRSPAILERPFGQGRVVLITTTADKEWTTLPDSFTYVVLMQELMQYVARPDPGGGDTRVGAPLVAAVEPGRFDPQAVVRTPAFPEEPDVSIEARPYGPDGTMQFTWTDTRRPGVYRFSLRETGGTETVRLATVNVDAKESNLAGAPEAAVRNAAGDLPITYVAGGELVADDTANTRRELWPSVLIALVVVLLVESGLAWWFGSRSG